MKLKLEQIAFVAESKEQNRDLKFDFDGLNLIVSETTTTPIKVTKTTRFITSINGYPFYRSSGENSGYPNTWFPFTGILDYQLGHFGKGWFKKPNFSTAICPKVRAIIRQADSQDQNLSDLEGRFATIPSLLISSLLGGGFWDSDHGKRVEASLKEQYADFYNSAPSISFAPSSKELGKEQINEVNEWLCAKARENLQTEVENHSP